MFHYNFGCTRRDSDGSQTSTESHVKSKALYKLGRIVKGFALCIPLGQALREPRRLTLLAEWCLLSLLDGLNALAPPITLRDPHKSEEALRS